MDRPVSLLVAAALACVACGGAAADASHKGDGMSLKRDLALSLVAHREWSAAVQPLLELAAQRPGDPEIQTLLGTVYREQGLFEQAEAAYASAIRIDPRSAGAYEGRGILREVSRFSSEAALEDLKMAVRLSPGDAAYSNNLGFALSVRGRYEEAVAALQDGLRRDPMSRRMRNNLGFAYAKIGQFDRARREFEHGGSQDEVENNMGYAFEQAGDLRAACAHYREALADNPLLKAASENAKRVCADAGAPSQGRTP